MTETPKPQRRRPRRREEEGRRLHSAGSAVVVSAAALLVSLFLNAPGLHKSATIQPEGWKRDVALAVTGPIETASGALLLDEPRRGLKAALGRSDDDEIDTAVAVPKPPEPESDPEPEPAPRTAFSPAKPLRLWIAGDSLVVVPGESILRAVGESRAIRPVAPVDARIASGLERPDVFNWFRHVREQMKEQKPRAVVLMFGANDDHGFMTGLEQAVELDGFAGPR